MYFDYKSIIDLFNKHNIDNLLIDKEAIEELENTLVEYCEMIVYIAQHHSDVTVLGLKDIEYALELEIRNENRNEYPIKTVILPEEPFVKMLENENYKNNFDLLNNNIAPLAGAVLSNIITDYCYEIAKRAVQIADFFFIQEIDEKIIKLALKGPVIEGS